MNRSLLTIVAFAAALSWAGPASAFCGFYVSGGGADLFNEATQVVLMRHDNKTALSMQNNYKGPTEDFAMVVPVPVVLQEENVKTLEKSVFDKIDRLSAPRLVEYWERDPCRPRPMPKGVSFGMAEGVGVAAVGGAGAAPPKVVVEAKFSVAEYDIVILSASEATALSAWLKENKYEIPDGATPYLQPYIESGMYFFVAKVNAQKVKFEDGEAVLSPLRFDYESEEFSLPIRLGMINSTGKQDLIAYILAKNQRYETANYENVTIPTNIEVNKAVKDDFAGFYEALFDRTLEENPNSVVTEYSWAAANCDPCPTGMIGGATVSVADLKTLGADELGAGTSTTGWVLTRLHARYEPDDIGEDLVFRKAEPIAGGREVRVASGALEKGANQSVGNNFQGRYIIRNEWSGAVECEDPEYGVWGGPPSGGDVGTNTAPSANTRGEAAKKPSKPLAELLKGGLDSLVSTAEAAPPQDEASETEARAGESETSGGESVANGQTQDAEKGCASGCAAGSGAPAAALLLVAFAGLRRRRRRRTR